MKNIHLYIGEGNAISNDVMEVEFSTPPDILFTYQETDLNNPTIVKNGFSKTITIEGTPNNNQIFGHFWNVERISGGGGNGVGFNPSRKVAFKLCVDADIYEQGYVKLDNVYRNGKNISYDVTLYGGLGDFFYNLDTNENGDTLKLSDLDFGQDLTFTINKETVKEAWDALKNGTSGKWQTINFMTANNGYPDDFDCDKVIMNMSGLGLTQSKTDDGKTYGTTQGFVLGELPDEMTEAEIRDMRSYLQRPCIRMKEVINACCDSNNNGGYTVDLDTDFFKADNPYWEKTWLTLPMTSTLEYSNDEQILEGATLITATTTGNTDGMMYQDLDFDLGNWSSSVPSYVSVNAKIKIDDYFQYTSYEWFWNWNGNSYHSGWDLYGSLFVQMIAMNGDTVVGASNAYNLTSPIRHNGNLYYGNNGRYDDKFSSYMDKPIYDILGRFGSDGFRSETSAGVFATSARTFNFYISNLNSPITGLKIVYYWGANASKKKKYGRNRLFGSTYSDGWMSMSCSSTEVGASSLNANLLSTNVKAVIGDSLGRTGTQVTQNLLLNTESSPCDYLLSYCKMFGLYFTKDVDSNTIHIQTRKTFYDRTKILDLNDYIDRSQQVEITPITFDTKWYQFSQEKDETTYSENYLTNKGVEYGCKIFNTGYEFNSEKNYLLEENCIKSGIEGVEKSKYFTMYNNDNTCRPWFGMGYSYQLVNGDSTLDVSVNTKGGTAVGINENNGMKYYDAFPKLQFHDKDNKPTDGNNVLVFFSGFKNVVSGRTNKLSYYLTDDTVYQTLLNEGTPCWFFTSQEYKGSIRIAYKLSEIPVFERYLTNADSGKVEKSLDFGTAQEIYVPDYNITDASNIYTNFWKTYIEDLYNVDTKKLTCYVKVVGRPNPEWLSRFYWFENAIWRCNKIIDWNVSSYDTTQMEFVKVQDLSDYTTISQSTANTITITSDKYNIPYSGGSATLTISVTNNASWRIFSQTTGVTFSRTTGTGDGTVTATFATNTEDDYRVFYINGVADNGATTRKSIRQSFTDEVTLKAVPEDIVIPATGGTAEIEFIWTNQGDNYIYFTDHNEGEEYLQFYADTTTYRTQNKAVLTFDANTGTTTLHNYCTFYNNDMDINVSIGIDQLPPSQSFAGTGTTKSLAVFYASGATFEEVPYWLTVENSGSSYVFKAQKNLQASAQTAVMYVVKGKSRVPLTVNLGEDDSPILSLNRYAGDGDANPSGQSINLVVECNNNPWSASSNQSYCTLNMSTGSGYTTALTATFAANTGGWRDATITVTDSRGSAVTYSLAQSSNGGGSVTGITVTPQLLKFPISQSTKTVTITDPNGASWEVISYPSWISVSSTSGSATTTINVTAQANTGTDQRASSMIIADTTNGLNYTVLLIQTGTSGEYLRIDPSEITFESTGGTATFTISSNNEWIIE